MPDTTDQLARDVVTVVTTMTRLAPIDAIRQMLERDPTPELAAFVTYWETLSKIPRDDGDDVVVEEQG